MNHGSNTARSVKVDATVYPGGEWDILTPKDIARICDKKNAHLQELLRQCALAVLISGSDHDNKKQVDELYQDFTIAVSQRDPGVRLELRNAPPQAFVDGNIIRGVASLLFAVVRDVAFMARAKAHSSLQEMDITEAIFRQLQNARVLRRLDPNLVVCWGGHSISRTEYLYTKKVGYALGLRGLDICTGCGPGAMKGPMKGATIAHAKQHRHNGRYIGVTEPGIIASESPNPIVNHLVIIPDIEKRLETFMRLGHGIIVFPGGVGTIEEVLYFIGVLMHEKNRKIPFPFIFTGPESAKDYFQKIDYFIKETLGNEVSNLYQVIIDDAESVAKYMLKGMYEIKSYRKEIQDTYYFNWSLHIPEELKKPFIPTHQNMQSLNLRKNNTPFEMAVELRRAFSGIVAGNVKKDFVESIKKNGPFKIQGDLKLMTALDTLLRSFIADGRMKMQGEYIPCYTVG